MFKQVSFALGVALISMSALVAKATNIPSGVNLDSNQIIYTEDNKYFLAMQGDGNLVYYRANGTVRWNLGSQNNPGAWAAMQGDGNFVVYTAGGGHIWNAGTQGNPGAYLSIQGDGNIVVRRAGDQAALWHIGGDPEGSDPQNAADVVGRNLDVPGIGALGHIGIYDGGSTIYEVLNEGNANRVKANTLADFKSRTQYWGAAKPAIPDFNIANCYGLACPITTPVSWMHTRFAMVQRANQIRLLGADYTYGASYTPAEPRWESGSSQPGTPAKRGLYRCDTYVLNVYEISQTAAAPAAWTQRLNDLKYGVVYPRNFFDKIASWQ